MGNQTNVEQPSKQESRKHIHEDVIGKVRYRVYRNVTLKGVDFKVQFFRDESRKGKKWLAETFFHEDMVNVAKAATASYIYLRDNTDCVFGPVVPEVVKVIPVNESAKSPPAHMVQVGDVLGSVFENTSPAGKVYHKFSFCRAEKIFEEDWFFNNFRPEDLSHVAQAATACRMWYDENIGSVRRRAVTEEGEEKRPAKRKPRRAAK